MNKKAVALFSGGLDSMLAIKLMLEQGIDVHALNFLTVFCTCTSKGCMHQATKAAKELHVPLKVMNITMEYMDVIKNPKYGTGKAMNPCIDCRIFTFSKAKEFMNEIAASFVITGEVLGQRPMSQRRQAIEIIERESGLQGLILRPLSAKSFDATLPEKNGIVDRDKLLNIYGRARTRQIELAETFGINDYPCPAGGCLLTEKGFCKKLQDLFQHKPDYTLNDLHLLKIGRHFKVSNGASLVVGRDEKENERLLTFAVPGDYIFDVIGIPCPIGLARGNMSEAEIHIVSSIMARYSDEKNNKDVKVFYKVFPAKEQKTILVKPAIEETILSLRI